MNQQNISALIWAVAQGYVMYEAIRLITKAYSRLLTPYATSVYDFSKHSWSCGDFRVHGAYENQWVMEDFGGALGRG